MRILFLCKIGFPVFVLWFVVIYAHSASAENCGNYLMHNLGMAKWYAEKLAQYLEENRGNSAIFEYPKTQRLVTVDGQQFYDS